MYCSMARLSLLISSSGVSTLTYTRYSKVGSGLREPGTEGRGFEVSPNDMGQENSRLEIDAAQRG